MVVPFVHLHVHSMYSLHDGAARPEELVEEARRLRFTSLALTDHGTLQGAPSFFRSCHEAGIRPILGCELYVHTGAPPELSPENDEPFNLYHQPILVQNALGYRNLCRLIAASRQVRNSEVPSVSLETVRRHHEGLIALSGCLRGHVPRLLQADRKDEALETAALYRDLFGAGNYFIELHDHGKREERGYLPGLLEISQKLDLPVVASNDAHFARRGEFDRQQLVIAISQNRTLSSVQDFNHYTDAYYLRSGDEMSSIFREVPQALKTSVDIADRCHFRLHDVPGLRPRVAGEGAEEGRLVELVEAGLAARGLAGSLRHRRRLDEELALIAQRRLASHFLVLRDLVTRAGESGIPISTNRGIAASSLVGWLLGVSDVDPIQHGLHFEPEAGPGRAHPPHVVIEVSHERRQELMGWLFGICGGDGAALVAEPSFYPQRAAVYECARALESSPAAVEAVLRWLDGSPHSLSRQIRAERDPWAISLAQSATTIEGLLRATAAAKETVVLTGEPVPDCLPATRESDGYWMTQYAAPELDQLGFARVEFLGNRALHVLLLAGRGVAVGTEDPNAYDVIARNPAGISPLDTPAASRLLFRPRKIEELAVLIALARIAQHDPVRAGEIDHALERGSGRPPRGFPELAAVLGPTGGVLLFAEQVEAILRGFSDGSVHVEDLLEGMSIEREGGESEEQDAGSDVVDVAGHRIRIRKELRSHLAAALRGGPLARRARTLLRLLAPAKVHLPGKAASLASALLAYRLAHLKAYYPVDFIAAKITARAEDDQPWDDLEVECGRLSVALLPPDINLSVWRCAPEDGRVRYGLVTVHGLGEQAAREVVRARQAAGWFESFSQFLFAFDSHRLHQDGLAALVRAGCFDSMGIDRRRLQEKLSEFLELKHRRERLAGQTALFDLEPGEAAALEAEIRRDPA